MGSAASSPPRFVPNVRERHSCATYIAISIDPSLLPPHVVPKPLELDLFDGSAWICVVVDDLDSLEAYVSGIGRFVPTRMSGWMMKLNVMVRCPVGNATANVDESESDTARAEAEALECSRYVRGYLIHTLDFERCASGWIKTLGARSTQKVGAEQASFAVSSGASGAAARHVLEPGTTFSCTVDGVAILERSLSADATPGATHDERRGVEEEERSCAPEAQQTLLSLRGVLRTLPPSRIPLVSWIVQRPTKFLAQRDAATGSPLGVVFSPELGDGAALPSASGCVAIDLSGDDAVLDLQLLQSRLGLGLRVDDVKLGRDRVFVFVQPEYLLVDHVNVAIKYVSRLDGVVPVVSSTSPPGEDSTII